MQAKKQDQDRATEDNFCPSCHKQFVILKAPYEPPLEFCPYCSSSLHPAKAKTIPYVGAVAPTEEMTTGEVTLIKGHVPEDEEISFTIGPYQVLRSIGKGGMGEVYLAYDTSCGRRIALKRIREDLVKHKQIHNRFLKEARITSQLPHPAIIPIYAIHTEDKVAYYTMPFVEGETLKQIFRKTRIQEKRSEKPDHLGGSIPGLIRIFITVCQAVAFAHSKGVLHRDLKPENIIVGAYGEVLILDWGLAKLIRENEETMPDEETESHPLDELTRVGKVVGTLSYMAPERALGEPASIQTEVYALGVTLYQILTLHLPFQRKSLKEYRKTLDKETLPPPSEIAPYRDVPRVLSRIVTRCLSPDPTQRFQTVDELIWELENYIEGRSEWFQAVELDIKQKSDWEFQENILLAEHIAITRGTEATDWVNLMISKASFTENTKIEADVCIGEEGKGIGFLLSIPEPAERIHLTDGYCLWLGSDINQTTKLLRSTVEVVDAPEIFLQRGQKYRIRIEKVDNNIYFYLNNSLQFSFISHLPLVGTHVGILSRDANFELINFIVFVGSQNITVNCLAVPDAFLAHKNYDAALSEYRRIGYSFPGRAEGREAMFRAGISLLEQAKNNSDIKEQDHLFDLALEEFEKLHETPGAPLEYLGKALVYHIQGDLAEEIKCFELACRRYRNHPLLPVLQEQIVYRLYETSRHHRKATYKFILLVVRHLPNVAGSKNIQKLIKSLQNNWEPLYFIEPDIAYASSAPLRNQFFSIELAFWLARPFILAEIIDDLLGMEKQYPITLCNALFCLVELGTWEIANGKLQSMKNIRSPSFQQALGLIEIAILCHKESLTSSMKAFFTLKHEKFTLGEERVLFHLAEHALNQNFPEQVHAMIHQLKDMPLSSEAKKRLDCYQIWAHLLQKDWDAAAKLLHSYSLEELNQETSLLYMLYGCWLYATEGVKIAKIHFSGLLDISFPRSWALLGHYVSGHINEDSRWFQRAFHWEKRQLYRQLALFYHCGGESDRVKHFRNLEKQEYAHVDE